MFQCRKRRTGMGLSTISLVFLITCSSLLRNSGFGWTQAVRNIACVLLCCILFQILYSSTRFYLRVFDVPPLTLNKLKHIILCAISILLLVWSVSYGINRQNVIIDFFTWLWLLDVVHVCKVFLLHWGVNEGFVSSVCVWLTICAELQKYIVVDFLANVDCQNSLVSQLWHFKKHLMRFKFVCCWKASWVVCKVFNKTGC